MEIPQEKQKLIQMELGLLFLVELGKFYQDTASAMRYNLVNEGILIKEVLIFFSLLLSS